MRLPATVHGQESSASTSPAADITNLLQYGVELGAGPTGAIPPAVTGGPAD
jgi:hypothetical protein